MLEHEATRAVPSPGAFQRQGTSKAPPSHRFMALRFMTRDHATVSGFILVLFTVLAGLIGPLVAPHDPYALIGPRLDPPGATYLLGTDEVGRDILSRVLFSARISLAVALSAVTLSGIVGVTLGVLAGYFQGRFDFTLMRLMDMTFGFPPILLALVIMTVLGRELHNLVLALTIVYVPTFARIARGSTMSVVAEPYVEAARSVGAGNNRIMLQHVLPNIVPPLIVLFSTYMAYGILIEAALSFLGLGIQPPNPSWGSMLSSGKAYLELSPWVAVAPGVAIMIAVLGFNLFGDGLQDALDPKLRVQRS